MRTRIILTDQSNQEELRGRWAEGITAGMVMLGIDIGGTSVKAAGAGQGAAWEAQSERYERPSVDQLIVAIRECVRGRGSADAVGVCAPGIVEDDGRTVRLSVNIPSLNGVDLAELVGKALGRSVRVAVVTDALATAYDIAAVRGLSGRIMVICIGTGIGAAVLDDGRPLMVDGPTPGHLGQMDVSIAGEQVIGPDGGAGSLEGYIGGPALTKRFGELEKALPKLRGDEVPFLALARAIRIAHAIYRPNHVCLAGGIGIRLGHVLARLRQIIETDLTRIAREGWTLSVGDSDYHAARGAARWAGRNSKPESRSSI